jgi:mannose-1-phosphate guanylyltransferase
MAGTPPRALPVLRFREKPDADSARHYVESGRFLWNSGLFFWTLSTFLAELEAVNPPLAEAVLGMRDALAHDDTETVERVFAGIEGLSIDYALMEKAARVLVVPAGFAWDDVGAWDALDRTYPHDHDGNVVVGDPVLVDTQNCIVCNEPGAERMAVAVVGGRELVVVVSADGVLVVDKARVQDVKTAVQSLRNRNATQL